MKSIKGVEVSGVSDVMRKLDKLGDKIQEDIFKGVNVTAEYGRDKAKDNVSDNGSYVTGGLAKSIQTDPRRREMNVIVEAGAEYAYFVEFGRKKGKIPPVNMIAAWAKKKGIGEQAAPAIAFAIGKKGTQPRPFFYKAFDGIKRILTNNIRKAIRSHYD